MMTGTAKPMEGMASAAGRPASAVDGIEDAAGTRHVAATGEVRIVSLVPSLTELIF